jgi:hypothetical protein
MSIGLAVIGGRSGGRISSVLRPCSGWIGCVISRSNGLGLSLSRTPPSGPPDLAAPLSAWAGNRRLTKMKAYGDLLAPGGLLSEPL